MKHRHVEVPPDTPVESWPSTALVDLLDRGDLADWQPLLAAIADDPHGALAQRVRRLVDEFPMYGTSPLIRAWVERAGARSRVSRHAHVLAPSALRRHVGLTQIELAGRVGMSESDLSKFDRRGDVRVSTLSAYVEALGGRLRLTAELPDAELRIRPGGWSPETRSSV